MSSEITESNYKPKQTPLTATIIISIACIPQIVLLYLYKDMSGLTEWLFLVTFISYRWRTK